MNSVAIAIEAPSLLGAFLGGFVATLTPCVYPLIPITLSIVGAGAESSRTKAIFRSTLFCLGIVISYALLGLVAVISGSFFGSIWSSQYFRTVLGLAICAYAFISLDLINFKSDGPLTQAAAKLGGNTAIGAFAAGMASGILAAPCTGALLATILTFAATSLGPLSGFFLLIAYAVGFALPFFLLSLSPRALHLVPRSGLWLYGAKFLIGACLLALGFYYIVGDFLTEQLASTKAPRLIFILICTVSLLFSCFLGMRSYLNESKLLRISAALLIVLLFMPSAFAALGFGIAIEADNYASFTKSFEKARVNQSPIVLDFTADWCVKCKEMTRDIFSKDKVITALEKAEFISIDLTELSPAEKALQRQYEIRGLPAVLFLCPSGKELEIPRVTESIKANQFIDKLELAKSLVHQCS